MLTHVLVISSGYGLFKPMSGARNRFYNIIFQLLDKGFTVRVLLPSLFKDDKDGTVAKTSYYRNSFGKKTLAMLGDFNPDFIVNLIKTLAVSRPDLIHIASPFGAIVAKVLTKLFSFDSIIVYDAYDVQSDVYSLGAKNIFEKFFTKFFCLWQERLAVNCVDHVLTVSDVDRLRFIKKYSLDSKKLSVVPSGVDIDKSPCLQQNDGVYAKETIIVFHGAYSHPPNKQAFDLIRDRIAPQFLEIREDVIFYLAGHGLPSFKTKNVVSQGFVDDIGAFLANANLAIVPLKQGGGTRLKILDYMAMGLPIVTTKKGIEGIDAVDGEHMLIVKDVDENFLKAILRIINSKNLSQKLGSNARCLVVEKYLWSKIGLNLKKLYERLLGFS